MNKTQFSSLLRDVSLAGVAAFSGAILASATPDRAVFIAAGYAALRAAAGALYLWSTTKGNA